VARPALRSKQVRAAKAVGSGLTYAEAGAIVGRSKRTVTRWLQDPELRLIAEREGAVPGEVAPVEMLRTALHATKANGQPDWGTRLSAVRALAALPQEEDEPETQHQSSTPSITVYDLPPGATPVQHYPASGAAEAPTTAASEAPSEQAAPDTRVFEYLSPDGNSEIIGTWSPGARNDSTGVVKARVSLTDDPETSERWRAELAAGRLPHDSEDEL
jgi:Homeodomain-like domain-containing protein